MASIRRLVAIGRRMKISEMFNPLPFFARRARSRSFPRLAHDLNAAARSQPELPLHDDGFAGTKPVLDHQILIDSGAGNDGAALHGLVRLHDEHVGAVLTRLHSLIRDNEGVRLGSQPDSDPNELAGPELSARIAKSAFEPDRPGSAERRVGKEWR